MKRIVSFALVTALLVGCQDQPVPTAPPNPTALAISDGAHSGGNPHFFFYPPTVPTAPSPNGAFNSQLRPVVEICEWTGTQCVLPLIARFTMSSGLGDRIRLALSDQLYVLKWNTKLFALSADKIYRIRVLVDVVELGFADVDVVLNANQAAKVNTQLFIPVINGKVLPINFRIENGAFCGQSQDCGEAVIGTAGGTVVTNTGFAGTQIPAGALGGPAPSTAIVVVERVQLGANQSCLPSDLPQFEGCYRYRTIPVLPPTGFNVSVTVGVCLDADQLSHEQQDELLLHKFDPNNPSAGVVALPNVPAGFLTNCGGFAFAKPEASPAVRLAFAGWGTLLALLSPEPLYAAHRGLGGLTGSFSQVGWALPAIMSIRAGDNQSAPVNTTLPRSLVVFLADSAGLPVAGVRVTFTVTSGGGSILNSTVQTGPSGLAEAAWTLGPIEGTQTLTAAASGAVGSPVTFTATGTTGD